MAEPLTTAELKAHLRKTTTDEDTLIATYGVAAREWCEDYTGYVLATRTFTEQFAAWGGYLTIYKRPLVSITTIEYDSADEDQAAFEDFAYSAGQYPLIINPTSSFPSLRANGFITVTYTAGYAAAGDVPEKFKWAIKLLVTSMHTNRGTIDEETERAVRFILRSYRGVVAA